MPGLVRTLHIASIWATWPRPCHCCGCTCSGHAADSKRVCCPAAGSNSPLLTLLLVNVASETNDECKRPQKLKLAAEARPAKELVVSTIVDKREVRAIKRWRDPDIAI